MHTNSVNNYWQAFCEANSFFSSDFMFCLPVNISNHVCGLLQSSCGYNYQSFSYYDHLNCLLYFKKWMVMMTNTLIALHNLVVVVTHEQKGCSDL